MPISITDESYSYKRRDGAFPAAWAAMYGFFVDKTAQRGVSVTAPTRYTMDGNVYAAWARSNTDPTIAWILNGGNSIKWFMGNTAVARTDNAYNKPFMVCVTYGKFSDIPAAANVWRELGVNPASTGNEIFAYTNRLISPQTMGDYVYIKNITIFDNSNDGNYSASNPRSMLSGYDIFTPVVISECKNLISGAVYNNTAKGVALIPLSAYMSPYYAANQGWFDFTQALFNVMCPVMDYLGTPISKMIQVAGLDANARPICKATLYPSVNDLLQDLHQWGVPYTTDYNAALYNNVSDLPDYTPDGVPDNPSGGGDGTGDNFSDPIDFPAAPFSPASLGGYLTLVQSPTELKGLTDVLWKPVIKDLSDALKVYFNTDNLTNSVLSIMFYPVDLAAMSLGLTHSDNIRIAWSTDNISADIMANNVPHEIDAGSYQMTEYYGSFLDYAPYTTADIWLPYIGYKPLDIDAVMDKTISVKYYVDFIDGLATAVIFADGQPINTYTGQLGIDLAVTGRDNAAKIRQSIDAVMTAVTGVNKAVGGVMQGAAQAMAGNAGGAVGALTGLPQAAAGVGVATMQTALQQPSTVIYGTAGGENWLSMPQKCHIKFTRTVAASPASYITELGYPTTYTDSVSKFAGYLQCAAVFGDFAGIPSEDADEIQTLLQNGVHITEGVFD